VVSDLDLILIPPKTPASKDGCRRILPDVVG
jgi:hypothetical protein